MTVRHVSDVIYLEGDCGVEEAEALLQAVIDAPGAPIDWSGCGRLHTAVLQLILATNNSVHGSCGDPWLERWVARMVLPEIHARLDVISTPPNVK